MLPESEKPKAAVKIAADVPVDSGIKAPPMDPGQLAVLREQLARRKTEKFEEVTVS